ncbi:MAG: GNAT family N-acetyltransferase [Phormidesmis sp.]
MGYVIRLAKESEIPALPEIERSAAQRFLPYLATLNIPVDLLEGLTTPRFLQAAQADRRLWVAVEREQPVGFIVAKFLTKICFVVELDVHLDYGRRGIGSALVEACCHGAQQRGYDQIMLTTFRAVPWNIPFYQRLGFEVMPAADWPLEISAIVQHEARYGFAQAKRAVMRRSIRP